MGDANSPHRLSASVATGGARAYAFRAIGHQEGNLGRPTPSSPQKENGRSPHEHVTDKRGIIRCSPCILTP
jgi:hypothetical protein